MKNTWTKLSSLLLALLLALSCFAFVACNEDTPADQPSADDTPDASDTPDTPDTPDATDDPATEPEDETDSNDYLLSIPAQDYGKAFTMLTDARDEIRMDLFVADEGEASGDLMDTAVFYRNNRVAEHLGVTFENITDDGSWNGRTSYINRIYTSFSSGDQDFQMATCYMAYAADGAIAGYYYDVNSIDAIDVESPWYVQSWFENTVINDQCYMLVGDLSMSMWRNLNAFYFNKQISDELGITARLYQMAEDREWTLEFLMECAQLSSSDNGNDIWDEEDTYGLYLNLFTCRAMVTYFDIPLTVQNNNGEYELCFYNERSETIYGTLHNYFWTNDCVYKNVIPGRDNDFDTGKGMFMEDRLLFLPGTLGNSQVLREMEGSWGILPPPLLDDQQETYYTHTADNCFLILIPGHAADPEFCGTVVDAMGAENKFSVVPTFYDVVLKGRTTKDEESVRMIDIIRENLTFDFAFAHLTAMDNMWTIFGQNLLSQASASFKPVYDRKADVYQAKLDEIMEAYWNVR